MERYLKETIIHDAIQKDKITFLSGPRQVGKTTLARHILDTLKFPDNYYTWDDDEFRKLWIKNPKQICNNHANEPIVFDEIHKDRKWKSKIKGLYDLNSKKNKFVVTGNARLDFYRKSGDSLQGRYFPYRLHPLSINETASLPRPPKKEDGEWPGKLLPKDTLRNFLELGPFPEPYLRGSKDEAQRWRRLYRERLIKEDLRDLTAVKDLEAVKSLALLLEENAGSRLSYESLREDLRVSFETVKRWIEYLEALYFCYKIRPYSKNIKRSVLKEPKIYLFDWAGISNDGHKIENTVASHLLKSCHAWTDAAYGEFQLYYLKDKQKREVDFFVTKNKAPYLLVEVKTNSSSLSSQLIYFQKTLKPEFCFQLVLDAKKERQPIENKEIKIIEISRFLSALV